tara:strand:+ start:102 stop:278 length:177 start_codon:yes stop_codon:yes gene_type:complete
MPRAKKKPTKKTSERRKTNVGKKPDRRKGNIAGNWRGSEDAFFNRVRKGWKKIFSPAK